MRACASAVGKVPRPFGVGVWKGRRMSIAEALVESLNTHRVTREDVAQLLQQIAETCVPRDDETAGTPWTVKEMEQLFTRVDVELAKSDLVKRGPVAATLLFADIGIRLTAAAKTAKGAEAGVKIKGAVKHVRDIAELCV